MGRSLDASDIKPLLYRNYEHPRWDEVLGWSWRFPSYRWQFDARALELTHTIALDGKCLRAKCDEDHSLGYEMVKRFARVIIERLQAARLQLLDVYGVRS
jgi:CRP/FNR family transcriptional regulator, cyclic AMP receptor protein